MYVTQVRARQKYTENRRNEWNHGRRAIYFHVSLRRLLLVHTSRLTSSKYSIRERFDNMAAYFYVKIERGRVFAVLPK